MVPTAGFVSGAKKIGNQCEKREKCLELQGFTLHMRNRGVCRLNVGR
jgi:hypothetical protein